MTLVVYQNARWEGSRSRPRGYEHTERSSLAALRHAWRKGLDRFTEQLTRFQRPSSWILLLGLSALILDYRCHGYFVNPDLRAEDGKMVYAFFFQSRDLREVLRFKAGYMPLVPNLLGYVAARLPPSAVPYFLALVPASFAAAVFAVFNAASFRRYVPSDRLRLCCCVGLALAPLANLKRARSSRAAWSPGAAVRASRTRSPRVSRRRLSAAATHSPHWRCCRESPWIAAVCSASYPTAADPSGRP